MKISMVDFHITFWFSYQIVYIPIRPAIVNIISISKALTVLEIWALPSRFNEIRKKSPKSEVNQTNVIFFL